MRWTKVSHNSQLCSEHQTASTPRAKRGHMNQVHSHRGKLHMMGKLLTAGPWFPIEAQKQITTASYNEQSEVNSLLPCYSWKEHETIFQEQFYVFEETEVTWVVFFWSLFHSTQNSPPTAPFLGHVPPHMYLHTRICIYGKNIKLHVGMVTTPSRWWLGGGRVGE